MTQWFQEGLGFFRKQETRWTLIAILVAAIVWQLLAFFSKPYIVPGLQIIAEEMFNTLSRWSSWRHIAASVMRIVICFIIAGMFGASLGLAMGLNRRLGYLCIPIVRFLMGIPALSYVLLVVIWFRGTEPRIFMVMFLIVFPVLAVNALDGVKSVPQALQGMMFAFRAERRQILFDLIIPSTIPFILSGARIGVSLGVRLVAFAELLGAQSGIGSAMYEQFIYFNVELILVWTIVLIVIMYLSEVVISTIEHRLLRWRPQISRGER